MVSSISGITMSSFELSKNEVSHTDSSLTQQRRVIPGHFGQLVSDLANITVDRLQTAEALSVSRIEGADLDMRKIVNSILEAEQTLTTTLAIRDKIVQGYLEISRMQI